MPQSLDHYLSSLLTKYHYPDQAKKDVSNALQHYRNLSPMSSQFVFNDGTKKELFCLDGTIPVSYKGNVYNIPVCVWLLDTHPYNSPMCYVKPTAYMQIKVSRHVDQTGRVFLPYLHEWNPSLQEAMGQETVTGLKTALFRRFRDGRAAILRGRPPSMPLGFPRLRFRAPNVYDFLPFTAGIVSINLKTCGASIEPSRWLVRPPIAATPLPSTTNTPAATAVAPTPAYPPYPTGSTASYPLYPTPGSGSGYPYPPASTVSIPATVGLPTSTGTITQEHIRASLLTAVEDKVKGRLKEVLSVAQAEMDVLKKTHDELNSGKTKLEDMINRMDREQVGQHSAITNLIASHAGFSSYWSKWMWRGGSSKMAEETGIDSPGFHVHLLAYAGQCSKNDLFVYKCEAVRAGSYYTGVERHGHSFRFVQHVRELSRKQFMLRALMQKCREKAALP
ncbi:unnamed protein product [Ixodes persulcatus]